MKSEMLVNKSQNSHNFSSNEESPETDESKDSIDFNGNLSFFNEVQVNDSNKEEKNVRKKEIINDKKDVNEKNEEPIINICSNINSNNNELNKINLNNNSSSSNNENNYFPLFNIKYKDFCSKSEKINNNFINNNINMNVNGNNLYNYNGNINNNFLSNISKSQNSIMNINSVNINNININKCMPSFNQNNNNINPVFSKNLNINYNNNKKNKKHNNQKNNNKKRINSFNNEILNFKTFIENLNKPLDIFICSQTGSRMLQNNLDNFSPQIIDILIDKIKLSFEKLMCDIYGNYFCQKLYSLSSFEQRMTILENIKDTFVPISKTKAGSHAAQSIIEHALCLEEKNKIMSFIVNLELEMALDTEGTHVLQKIIQIFQEGERQALTEVLSKSQNVNILCKDLKGISVIKRLICFNKEEKNRSKLVDALYDNCLEIVKTSSGSYILQFLLEEWGLETGIKLIFFSIYNFEIFAIQKHGANFINKIIILCLKKFSQNRYFANVQNDVFIKNEMIIINSLKNIIFDFNKIINIYKSRYAKALIFNIRKLFNREENEKLFLYIKSLEPLQNSYDNKKYQIYFEIYKSHLITL